MDALVLSQQNGASSSLLDLAIVEVSLHLLIMMMMMRISKAIRIYLGLAGLQQRLALAHEYDDDDDEDGEENQFISCHCRFTAEACERLPLPQLSTGWEPISSR